DALPILDSCNSWVLCESFHRTNCQVAERETTSCPPPKWTPTRSATESQLSGGIRRAVRVFAGDWSLDRGGTSRRISRTTAMEFATEPPLTRLITPTRGTTRG